jgi:hypothetical protein
VTATNGDAAPTCTTVTSGYVDSTIPTVVGTSHTDNFFASFGPTNLIATTAAATTLYRIHFHLYQTASGSGGTCATDAMAFLNFAWTTPANQAAVSNNYWGPLTIPPILGTCDLASATGCMGMDSPIVVKASSAITYSVTWADGNCTTQPTATVYVSADKE